MNGNNIPDYNDAVWRSCPDDDVNCRALGQPKPGSNVQAGLGGNGSLGGGLLLVLAAAAGLRLRQKKRAS